MNDKYNVLVVDDEKDHLGKIKKCLEGNPFVGQVNTDSDAIKVAKEIQKKGMKFKHHIIIADIFMPDPSKNQKEISDENGAFHLYDVIKEIKSKKGYKDWPLKLIIISSRKTDASKERLDTVLKDQRALIGSYEQWAFIIAKGDKFSNDTAQSLMEHNRWQNIINRAIRTCKEKEWMSVFVNLSEKELLGTSGKLDGIIDQINTSNNNPVILIYGEKHTGVEAFAKKLHNDSSRKDKIYEACLATYYDWPKLQEVLYGKEKSVEAGYPDTEKGFLEVANGGTIFINEFQAGKLGADGMMLFCDHFLKQLANNSYTYRRVKGSAEQIFKGSIIIGARSKEDFGALNDLDYPTIYIPPLRERREDIVFLAKHILCETEKNREVSGYSFSKEAEEAFEEWSWPANIEELKNTVEGIVDSSEPGEIGFDNIPERFRGPILAMKRMENNEAYSVTYKRKKLDGLSGVTDCAYFFRGILLAVKDKQSSTILYSDLSRYIKNYYNIIEKEEEEKKGCPSSNVDKDGRLRSTRSGIRAIFKDFNLLEDPIMSFERGERRYFKFTLCSPDEIVIAPPVEDWIKSEDTQK